LLFQAALESKLFLNVKFSTIPCSQEENLVKIMEIACRIEFISIARALSVMDDELCPVMLSGR